MGAADRIKGKRMMNVMLKAVLVLLFGGAVSVPLWAEEERLVTIGGDVTEIVFALGAGDQVVAVDTSSLYPPAVQQLPQLGYLRNLSAEGVLSVRADRILANSDMGPPPVKTQLMASGIALELIPNQPSLAALYEKIEQIAAALGRQSQGHEISENLRRKFATLEERRAGLKTRPGVLFIMNHGGGSPMIAGADTAPDTLISLMGGRNVASAIRGYKPMTPEAVVSAAPEWLLISDQGLAQFGSVDALFRQPGLQLTPAARKQHVISMDALLLMGFGPRTADAATTLFDRLHGGESAVADGP